MRPFSDTIDGNEGTIWFINYLTRKGFKDLHKTDKYCRWDVEGYYKDEKWCFELKNRSFPSFTYGDVFLNKDKYDYLVNECPYKTVLVTFFTDVWCMINLKLKSPQEIIHQKCKHQTVFDDHRVIDKEIVKWYIDDLKMIDYD